MKILRLFIAICIFYLLICILLFINQESFIFFPSKLDSSYQFRFDWNFEEVYVPTSDSKRLHGLLFKAENPQGLIFYLHGNAGSVDSWGYAAEAYLDLDYDIFILDYRGYGKSEGKIKSEQQFYEDAQAAYNLFKLRYAEENIVVMGYSIGTAAATKLARDNHPKMLILQAPYYSLIHLMQQVYPFIPAFILNYKFETFKYLRDVLVPVYIFHGNADELINYESSVKLQAHFKPGDKLFTLVGQGHNGINENPQFRMELSNLLR